MTTVRADLKRRGRGGGAIFAAVSETPLAETGHSFSDESLSLSVILHPFCHLAL